MVARQKPDEAPKEFAEGVQIPQPASPAQAAELADAPTEEDYAKEWSTYRAVGVCRHGRTVAATPGQNVPASHPDLPRWLEEGNARLISAIEADEAKAAKAQK